MPALKMLSLVVVLALAAGRPASAADSVALPPSSATGSVIVGEGITDDFDPVRDGRGRRSSRKPTAITASWWSNRPAAREEPPALLPKLVDRWWEARTEGSGFDPAGDVTILLDVGDRSIAMDVPPSLLAEAGLDLDALKREVISKVFVPQAKDMQYAKGLAELVTATQRTIQDRIAAKARRAEAERVSHPDPADRGGGLAGAGLLGMAWLSAGPARRPPGSRPRETRRLQVGGGGALRSARRPAGTASDAAPRRSRLPDADDRDDPQRLRRGAGCDRPLPRAVARADGCLGAGRDAVRRRSGFWALPPATR